MTFFNSFFGMSYIFLLPIFATEVLGVGPEGYGYLSAVPGAGALGMTFVAASLGNTRWKGPLLIGGASVFGLTLIAFAFSTSYPLSLALMFLGGASSTLYMVLVMTTLQARVPDRLRGRVMGIYGMTWSLLPLGALQAGLVADRFGAPVAVAIGGAAVAVFALVLAVSNGQIRGLGISQTQTPEGASQGG
jgi:MFS family permease